ncbi:MAG TPA: translation initiation factor IF-3 [Thermoanaerobaculia bacterium]|nr:translation initiation factor IF-3 [Thermoanaerobaculia bacterium]
MNERIRVREVRLVESDGSQAGIVTIEDALQRARTQELDLVEVAPTAKPPVCRIMDFGKFLYQQKKKAHESKKKQKVIHIKEVKFRPNIDDHDYDFKLKNVVRFLGEGDKVKATIQFRGREMARQDLGHKLVKRLQADLGESGVLESHPEMTGNRMHVIFGPPRNQVQVAAAPKRAAPAGERAERPERSDARAENPEPRPASS